MQSYRVSSTAGLAAAALFGVALTLVGTAAAPQDGAVQARISLGRGMNLGAALEAPREGEWGLTLKPQYFQAIKDAGFNSVRVPIRWSAHAMTAPPYTIAPEFFARIDWVAEQALSRDLDIVLDLHHYVDLYRAPEQQFPRLLALWDQIATHYRSFPDTMFFELVNEPSGELTDERWQAMIPDLIRTIRRSNPDREIIVGPGFWNSVDHLGALQLPQQDRHLIVTFHYYMPMQFTHQGASWVKGADKWVNVGWKGTKAERGLLQADFAKAAAWGHEHQRPLYLGEFGTIDNAEMDSRVRWTSAVARLAEAQGMSWAYWDFASSFGAYDLKAKTWRTPLLQALNPQ